MVSIDASDLTSVALESNGAGMAWGYKMPAGAGEPITIPNVTNSSQVTQITATGFVLFSDGTATNYTSVPPNPGHGSGPFPPPTQGLSNLVTLVGNDICSAALDAHGAIHFFSPEAGLGLPSARFFTNVARVFATESSFFGIQSNGDLVSTDPINIPGGVHHCVAAAAESGLDLIVVDHRYLRWLTQPTNVTVLNGRPAVFSVKAAGMNPSYQWTLNGTNITGATNAVLVILHVRAADAGVYAAQVTNGFDAITSSNATLQVVAWPYFDTNGLSVSGSSVTLRLDGLSTARILEVDASSNMTDWTPIFSNVPSATAIDLMQTNLAGAPSRFYRAVEH